MTRAIAAKPKTYTCSRKGCTIAWLEEHVRMSIRMQDGTGLTHRYCKGCCQDPELAVLLADVCNQPVKAIEIFVVYR